MEPQKTNGEALPKSAPENLPKTPEISSSPEKSRKLEHLPIGTLEQFDDGGNAEKNQVSDNSLQATAGSVTTIAAPQAPSSDNVVVHSGSDTPMIAADEDVIEKEWVNKAKKVINRTKGDPYAKEREVSKLQADYLQKRYGKQVKMSDDDNK